MKTNKLYLVGCLVAALSFCACSLDRTPDDPNTYMEFDQDAVFSKIFAALALQGQTGPTGDCDIEGIDGGTSNFYRMIWELQEFPTDEGWWVWGDPGVADLRIMNWDSSNDLVKGIYYRLNTNVTLCNSFLDETVGKNDDKTKTQRAEVRLIRALNYYYLLDMFGTVPFSEKVSTQSPTPKTRAELFEWMETELIALEDILPEKRLSLYRVDKVAAELLLTRLYLNAEIYTGTAQWDKAAEYAAKVMNSSYKLLTTPSDYTANGGYYYSPYQKLFMGDNDTNGAQDETIFYIYQDGNYCQSWGGARFLVNMFRDANWIPAGSTDSWACFRSSPEYIASFVDLTTAETLKADEYHMPALIGDDRAIFCSQLVNFYDRYDTISLDPLKIDTIVNGTTDTLSWSLKGTQSSNLTDCWGECKWTGVYSSCSNPYNFIGSDPEWPDTDIPFLRVAEAYLSYAEAVFRGGNACNGTAEAAIQALRDRAHNTKTFTISEDFLLDEWSREFGLEGRRRTDLVRFGQFAGETCTRNWEGRGKKASGSAPKAMNKKYNIFPIPESDVIANPNLAGINEANGY